MDADALKVRTLSKVFWRLVPFMMVLYLFNYLDRVNINVARLEMNVDLGFSDAVYGTGAAIFFIGYFFFEVPSNILLERIGARVWIARIMISWGLISAAFMFVSDKWSFYALRFLLGASEAGFFPGMLLYLTYWIPASSRTKVGAIFMTSIALAGVLGNPLNGWIMEHSSGAMGLKGWQWIFLLEGIATVLLGIAVYFFLTDKPEVAHWLDADERRWLCEHLEAEAQLKRTEHGRHHFMDAIRCGRVWWLSLIYMTMMFGFYSLNYWSGIIIKEVYPPEWLAKGEVLSKSVIGALNAIPFAGAIIGMVLIGRIADRTGARRVITAVCQCIGTLGLLGMACYHGFYATLFFMTLTAIGILGSLSPFWSLPAAFLSGTAAAAGIAFINSWGNLGGGYVGNELMGYLKDKYKAEPFSYSYGLFIDAGVLCVGIFMTLALNLTPKKELLDK